METAIEELQPSYHVGPVLFMTAQLKRSLITEAGAWKCAYGKALNEKCAKEMDELLEFMDNLLKKLLRPTTDLDDVRAHMASLGDIRYGMRLMTLNCWSRILLKSSTKKVCYATEVAM